jgi:hypothetical protein
MKDGGPAFPQHGFDPVAERFTSQGGMTLRDWFAGMAMQAYINRPEATQVQDRMIAECAYDMADAMLAERSKT